MVARKDADRRRRPLWIELGTFLVAALLLGGLIWIISTPAQRLDYLEAIGLAQPTAKRTDRAVLAPTISSSSIEYLPGLERPFTTSGHRIGSPCRRNGAANPSQAEERSIYRWTDADGGTHFSDELPDDIATEEVGTLHRWGTEDYSVSYRFIGVRGNKDLRKALEAELGTVFRFLENQLKIGELPPLHANIVIIGGEKRFIAYRDKYAPDLTTRFGYYDFTNNEAVVRWISSERSLPVVRHELTHLAIGNAFGELPAWLSEGFSEVVERLEASGSAITARLDESAIDSLAKHADAGQLPSVKQMMASSHQDWQKAGGEAFHYSLNWALVHYLLSAQESKQVLRGHFQQLGNNRCETNDTTGYFNTLYPGGLDQLDRDFKQWLKAKRARPLYY